MNDGVTVILLANVDEGGGFAVDAISKGVAKIYVPGVIVQGLEPKADSDQCSINRHTAHS